jgi:hypothetical protein
VKTKSLRDKRSIHQTKYPWYQNGNDRWDMVMIGEPDCHAYIVRYWSERWKSAAWCWILTMPRCVDDHHGPTYNGFESAPHKAKRSVERTIEREWQ